MNNETDKKDWFTYALILLASTVVVLVVMKIFTKTIQIPNHKKISSWKNLIISSSPSVGKPNASIKIIEFYSYSCEYCNILHNSLTDIQKTYPEEIVIYYKPIHMGKYGFDFVTAIAAHCADFQNSFSIINKRLFEFEGTFKEWKILTENGAIPEPEKFTKCIENRSFASFINRDEKISDSLGIRGVPYMIINGKGYSGSLSYSQIEAIVQKELK